MPSFSLARQLFGLPYSDRRPNVRSGEKNDSRIPYTPKPEAPTAMQAYCKFATHHGLYAFIAEIVSRMKETRSVDLDRSSLLLASALSKALLKRSSRILVISTLDVRPIAYAPIMNCLFAAKKGDVRIDCIGRANIDEMDSNGVLIPQSTSNFY